MNAVELTMRRINVKAFILADPVSVLFKRRPEPTRTPAGGFAPAGPAQALPSVQTARIVHNTRRYKNGLVNAEAGDIPQTDYLLIGFHDIDVEVNDTFDWEDIDGVKNNYRITGIHPFRQESTLCSIEFNGPKNRD